MAMACLLYDLIMAGCCGHGAERTRPGDARWNCSAHYARREQGILDLFLLRNLPVLSETDNLFPSIHPSHHTAPNLCFHLPSSLPFACVLVPSPCFRAQRTLSNPQNRTLLCVHCLLHCTTSTRTLSAALHKRSQDGIQRVILMIFRYIFSSSFFSYHLVYCRTFLIFRSRHSNALLYLTFQVFSSVGSPSLLFYHWHSDFDFTL